MICRSGVGVTKSTKSQKWKHRPLVVKSTQFKENTVESERGNCTKVWLKARTTTRTQQDHLTPPPLEATPPPAKPTRLRLIFLQFRWFPTGALRCSAALAGRGVGGSCVHGAVQVLQPVLPLPPALLQGKHSFSRQQRGPWTSCRSPPAHLVLLELLVLRVVGGQLQSAQRAGVGLRRGGRG